MQQEHNPQDRIRIQLHSQIAILLLDTIYYKIKKTLRTMRTLSSQFYQLHVHSFKQESASESESELVGVGGFRKESESESEYFIRLRLLMSNSLHISDVNRATYAAARASAVQ